MRVSYDVVPNFPGWTMAPEYFKSLIVEHGCRRVLEVGAGANPTLSEKFVRSSALAYVISDTSAEELRKARADFEPLVLDLSASSVDPTLTDSFDCVMSRMVSEHIKDGEQHHKNIFSILRPGGISAHCFSTLWNLPLAANRLLPERLGGLLQPIFAPRDEHFHGKFKAYYSWSRGPTKAMIRRFEKIGFEVVVYVGYFGHNYYIRVPWLHRLEALQSRMLLRCPIPQFCAYATIVLRKPKHI